MNRTCLYSPAAEHHSLWPILILPSYGGVLVDIGRGRQRLGRLKCFCQSSIPCKFIDKAISEAFYSAPQCSHCKRWTSYGNSVCLSVCLSVRLSHGGLCHSKRLHVARCSLHCQIAKLNVSSFVETKTYSPETATSPWNLGSIWPTH